MTNQPLFRVFMVDKCEKTVERMVLVLYNKPVYHYCTTLNDEKVGEYHFKTSHYSCELFKNTYNEKMPCNLHPHD